MSWTAPPGQKEPPAFKAHCGCVYGHEWEQGGFGSGPSGWDRNTFPDIECLMHLQKRVEEETSKIRADAAAKIQKLEDELFLRETGVRPEIIDREITDAQEKLSKLMKAKDLLVRKNVTTK